MDVLKIHLNLLTESPYFGYIVGGGVAFVSLIVVHKKLSKSKKRVSEVACPKDTVLLYQFPRGPSAPSVSPFPIKLETYLRMANIPYVTDTTTIMSSKGKIPWISYNGQDVADSQFSIEFLNAELQVDLDKHLSKEERAQARSFQVMFEEHVYWCLVVFRWVLYKQLNPVKKIMHFPSLAWHFLERQVAKAAHGQGMGRHSPQEVEHKIKLDLQALSHFLGEKSFLMGEVPCEADCSIFGFLVQLVYHQKDPVLGGLIKDKYPNLCAYTLRMKEKFWPDWNAVSKKQS